MKKIILLVLLIASGISGFTQSQIYTCSYYPELRFKTFQPETCVYDSSCYIGLIGGGRVFTDVTFTPNGRLYGIVNLREIYQIDLVTCSCELICALPFIPASYPSLEALSDSVLLTDLADTLYAINLNTCSIKALGDIGYSPYTNHEYGFHSDGDLAWLDDYLYTVAGGKLFRIELNEEGTAILSSTLINESELDEPIPASWGLAGYVIGENNKKLLSFGPDTTVYLIDTETGIVDSFCTNPYATISDPGYAWGAAVQWPELTDTTDTDTTTALRIPTLEKEIFIYPNPAQEGLLHVKSDWVKLGEAKVNLYDMQGKRQAVYYQTGSKEIHVLLPHIPSGTYLVEVITNDGVIRKKISIAGQ